eukprot:scaffold53969_cov72-Phaeocystis_antarctica.AAC.3
MNVETCGHVADLIVMAHAFAELRDGVVARQHEERFQMWAQFRSNPLRGSHTYDTLSCKHEYGQLWLLALRHRGTVDYGRQRQGPIGRGKVDRGKAVKP